MVTIHRALIFLGAGLLVALALILVRRGKARQCFLFSAYVVVATCFTSFFLVFPRLYSPRVFMVKQGIYDSLIFGMALELSIRSFAAFQGIARRARLLLAAAVALSTTVIFLTTPADVGYESFVAFEPRIAAAGIWCLAFVGLLIVHYQIPVAPFTRSIILGFVPYLLVFTVYEDLIARLGWGAIRGLNLLNAAAYDTVAAYWVYSAWRKD